MPSTRRDEAVLLAEDLLTDIELGRIDPMAVVRKASRLARLLDDAEAMQWLRFEATGYSSGSNGLDSAAWSAATRSCRIHESDGERRASTTMLGTLSAEIEAATLDLNAGTGDTSDSQYAVVVENNKAARRNQLRQVITNRRALIDKVLGAVYQYAAENTRNSGSAPPSNPRLGSCGVRSTLPSAA
jgi:AbiTii